METAVNASQVVVPVAYTLLVVAYAGLFARGRGGLALYARSLLAAALVLHLFSILLRSLAVRACPLGSTAEFLSLMAFSMTAIYLVLELRIGERSAGVFALTPAFVLQVIASVSLLEDSGAAAQTMGFRRSLHVFATIVGFSAVGLCSVYGLLYLFLYGAIKGGRFGLFFQKMPSLERLSALNLVATELAFVALSATIGLGLWGYFEFPQGAMSLSHPVIILTFLLWLLYGGCAVARRYLRLGGKRLAYTTVVGLFLALGILVEFLLRGSHF